MTDSDTGGRRVAIVTGAGRDDGIGAAIVRALAQDGVRAIAADLINEAGFDELSDGDGEVTTGEYVYGDVSTADSCRELAQEVLRCCGRVDILVNNAAAPHGEDRRDVPDVPIEAWERVMAIGVRAPFVLMQQTIPSMRERGWGRIISIASADGLTARPRKSAYATSKAALIELTRSVAVEVAAEGITANSICPGPILSYRARANAQLRVETGVADSVEEAISSAAQQIPVGHHGTPDDVARIVRYLASDDGSFVTAAEWGVHGGELWTGYLPI